MGERLVSSTVRLGTGGHPLCRTEADPLAMASSSWQIRPGWLHNHRGPRLRSEMHVLGVGQFEGKVIR